jgi:translocation and assembly module TamB
MMTVLKRFLTAVAVVALLFCGFAFWLLSSTSGLRWAIGFTPDMLTVESFDGDLSDFSFNNLRLSLDGSIVLIERGSLQWAPFDLLSRRASVESLSIDGVEIELSETKTTTAEYQPWQGLTLPIDISIDRAVLNNISVTSIVSGSELRSPLLALSKIELSADVDDSVLKLTELALSAADNLVRLKGEIDLSAKADGLLKLSHTLNWQIDQMKFESNGQIGGTWASINMQHNQVAPASGRVTATVNNALSDRITWSADLLTSARNSQQLMGQTVSLGAGEIKLKGRFFPAQGLPGLSLDIAGQTSITSADYSQWGVATDLSLIGDELTIDTLSLSQLGQRNPANLSITGEVSHLSRFLEQTDLPAADQGRVDINGVWSSLSWPLTSNTDSTATQMIADGRVSVVGSHQRYTVLASAKGKAYDRDLDADINMALIGRMIELDTLAIRSGKSRMSASGKIGDHLDLNWSIASPDIGDFLVDGSGPLVSTGRITGQAAKPKISLRADSKGLSFAEVSIEDISLSAEASLAAANDAVNISLRTGLIRQDQTKIANSVALEIGGRVQAHLISLESSLANNAMLNLRAKGRLFNDQWSGVLSELDLNDSMLGAWALKNEIAIEVAKDIFSVSQSCLVNQAQSLCIEANMNAQSTKAIADITMLDLANLNRFAQLYDLSIEGQAEGKLSYLKGPKQVSATIDGYLESSSAVLTWQETSDHELADESLVFESLRASIKQADRLQGSIEAILANADTVTAELTVDQVLESSAFMQAPARGRAMLAIADLSVLPTVLLEAVSLNGAFDAEIDLKGSLSAPEIVASGELKNARADIPELGLQLEELELNVTSDGTSKVDVRGQLRSGNGELLMSGNVDFLNLQAPKVTLVFDGQNLQLAETPELIIVGDINLTAKLENQLLDLRGGVVIDRAELDFKVPETAVLVSTDVILKGQEVNVTSLKQRLKISVDLGTKTNISAQGLDANLLGKLRVFHEPGGILRGEGEITVNNGRYRAYGQDLKINKGRLLFDGGSIEDPSLDLKAEKTVDSITAGVSVRGRASAPRLNLYSSPSMQDDDILSVLIFNKPVGNLGSQDGFTLLRIANSLRNDGTNEVTKMTEKLQRSLGLSSLELQLTSDAPSLYAGKQLSSTFYVGYGYGLLDAAQSLILRYNLSEAWSIKADLGADSGADLRYQIEH